ncbi:hypothetical protein BKA69DRAFT_1042806 [Paraphysoderma sedebokerense]|nr:hypothetical protein BKA69DRAFT_1042806 [Paraphysoderma sedebokerense]
MSDYPVVYALHDFNAEDEDEVTFKVGDEIVVLEKDEEYNDGWWMGRTRDGQIGLFPANFVSERPPQSPSKVPQKEPDTIPLNDTAPESQSVRSPQTKTKHPEHRNSVQSIDALEHFESLMTDLRKSIFKTSTQLQSQKSEHSTASNRNGQSPDSIPLLWKGSQSREPEPETKPAFKVSNSSSKIAVSSKQEVPSKLSSPTYRSRQPETWTVEEVADWLSTVNFGNYSKSFEENEISGDVLLDLSLSTLKELDISALGKRIQIMNAIMNLKEEYGILPPSDDGRISGRSSAHSSHYSTSSYPRSTISNPDTSSYSGRRPSVGDADAPPLPVPVQEYQELLSKNSKLAPINRPSDLLKIPTPPLSPSQTRIPLSPTARSFHSADTKPISPYSSNFPPTPESPVKSKTTPYVSPLTGAETSTNRPIISDSVLKNVTAHDIKSPEADGYLKTLQDTTGLFDPRRKDGVWKKRWIVLKDGILYWFKDAKHSKCIHYLRLNSGFNVSPDNALRANKQAFRLVLPARSSSLPPRIFYFYTDDSKVYKNFLRALTKASIIHAGHEKSKEDCGGVVEIIKSPAEVNMIKDTIRVRGVEFLAMQETELGKIAKEWLDNDSGVGSNGSGGTGRSSNSRPSQDTVVANMDRRPSLPANVWRSSHVESDDHSDRYPPPAIPKEQLFRSKTPTPGSGRDRRLDSDGTKMSDYRVGMDRNQNYPSDRIRNMWGDVTDSEVDDNEYDNGRGARWENEHRRDGARYFDGESDRGASVTSRIQPQKAANPFMRTPYITYVNTYLPSTHRITTLKDLHNGLKFIEFLLSISRTTLPESLESEIRDPAVYRIDYRDNWEVGLRWTMDVGAKITEIDVTGLKVDEKQKKNEDKWLQHVLDEIEDWTEIGEEIVIKVLEKIGDRFGGMPI